MPTSHTSRLQLPTCGHMSLAICWLVCTLVQSGWHTHTVGFWFHEEYSCILFSFSWRWGKKRIKVAGIWDYSGRKYFIRCLVQQEVMFLFRLNSMNVSSTWRKPPGSESHVFSEGRYTGGVSQQPLYSTNFPLMWNSDQYRICSCQKEIFTCGFTGFIYKDLTPCLITFWLKTFFFTNVFTLHLWNHTGPVH